MTLPRIADLMAGEWQEHPRFPGISMKGLLTAVDNPMASVNAVQVPAGVAIGCCRPLVSASSAHWETMILSSE